MTIEKILVAMEHHHDLTRVCLGTQQISEIYFKDMKMCFVSKLYDNFKCDYKVLTDYGVYCNYKK